MLLIKYSLPLLYLWLGYNAIHDYEDLLFFLKKSLLIMAIYAFFIGGFSAKILPWLYVLLCFKTGGMVIAYASLADFFSALFVVPLGLYVIDKKRKWLIIAAWILLSTNTHDNENILECNCFDVNSVLDESLDYYQTNISNENLVSQIFFDVEEPPRWIILIGYNQICLLDRNKWAEKRFLESILVHRISLQSDEL